MVDVTSVANEVSTLLGIITVTVIPAVGGLAVAITTFIHNHSKNQQVLDLTDRISAAEAKVLAVDKQVADNKDKIGIAVDAGAKLTGTTDAITAHDAQLKALEQKLAGIVEQINTIKGSIPAN